MQTQTLYGDVMVQNETVFDCSTAVIMLWIWNIVRSQGWKIGWKKTRSGCFKNV